MSLTRRRAMLVVLLLASPVARADEWPQWMGPRRDNVWREEGILETFPAGGPKVLWRAEVRGGYAGPAVAGGRVFVTDFVPEADLPGTTSTARPCAAPSASWPSTSPPGSRCGATTIR